MDAFYARLSLFRKKPHEPGSFYARYSPIYLKLMTASKSLSDKELSELAELEKDIPDDQEELFHYLWLLNAKARYQCFVKEDYESALETTTQAILLLPGIFQKTFAEENFEKRSILFIFTQNMARLSFYSKSYALCLKELEEFKRILFQGMAIEEDGLPSNLRDMLNSEGLQLVKNMSQDNLDYYRKKVISLEEKLERRDDRSLLDSFNRHVMKNPDAQAFYDYDQGQGYSWRELDEISNAIASLIPECKFIFLCTKHSILHPAGLIAAWKRGSTPLMIHENYTDHELSQLQMNIKAEIPAIIDQEKLINKFRMSIFIDETMKLEEWKQTPGEMALGLFTSGSTGVPKLCLFSHEDLLKGAEIELFNEPVYKDDSGFIANLRPHFTSAGLNTLWPALLRGNRTLLSEKIRKTPMARFLTEMIVKEKLTLLVLSPTYLLSLLQNDESAFKSSYPLPLYFGGSSLSWNHLQSLLKNNFLPAMRYGMTEVAHIIAKKTYSLSEAHYNKADVGIPFRNFECFINDDYVQIKSPGLMSKVVDQGIEREIHQMYLTTDKASINEHGSLLMEGRDNRTININGFRFNTQQVEDVLNAIPGVKDSRVIEHNHALTAFILGESFLEKGLKESAAHLLSPFKRPAKYFFMDEWPKGLNGKIDFNELLKKLN